MDRRWSISPLITSIAESNTIQTYRQFTNLQIVLAFKAILGSPSNVVEHYSWLVQDCCGIVKATLYFGQAFVWASGSK